MNTDTGKVYRGDAEISAAKARGERLAPVSEKVAKMVEAARERRLLALRVQRAQANRGRKRRLARRRSRLAMEKASRRKNARRR